MRFTIPFSVLVLAGCSEAGVTKYNSDPEVSIASHRDDDTVREGVVELLRGQVGDPNHPIEDLTVSWLIDDVEVCPESAPNDAGVVSCEAVFELGGGKTVLEVRDPEGAGASAQVLLDVQPTDAPQASISAPLEDGIYYADQMITFHGTASDTEDGPDDLVITWETSELGDLGLTVDITGEGEVEAFGNLDEGDHAVRLRVVDSSGKEGSASVVIDVGPPNSAPTCLISSPTEDTVGADGELVIFTGKVSDVDVSPAWLDVAWKSDKDGPLGDSSPDTTGDVTFPISDLTVDAHVITMTVTDEVGADCVANVVYTVGMPPTLDVSSPMGGSTLNHSEPVAFSATVDDNEDLPNEIAITWESDIDGVFSEASADSSGDVSFTVDTLTFGDHNVTVTATDTDGLFVTSNLSFSLNRPPTTPDLTLGPDPAYTTDNLLASASGSVDPEGSGTITYTYEWFEDGVASSESTLSTFPAAATAKYHTYRVQVTPSDGTVDGTGTGAEIEVSNSSPVVFGPVLSTPDPRIGDTLVCTATVTDADTGDSPTSLFEWSDGSTGESYAVTLANEIGEEIVCTVTANDGDGGVTTASATAIVTNSSPMVDTVVVSPDSGRVGDALACSATASDADGDEPTLSYAWSTGGTGPTTLIEDTSDPGHLIVCTATAVDMYGATGSNTASATVLNTDPVMGPVTITPNPANNSDTLRCEASATDEDGDTPTLTYAWSTGASGIELPLTSIIAASGDTLNCTATATDADGGTASGSDDITLMNRAPSVSASLGPDSPTRLSTLTCSASEISDPDDDATTLSFEWTVVGVAAEATSTTGTESTLAAAFSAEQTVVCDAIVDDGKGGTTTATATVEILNTTPEVPTASMAPISLYTLDVLSVDATSSDADEDTLTLTYQFTVDGLVVQDGTSPLLLGADHFDKHQSVAVTVTADDGFDSASASLGPVVVLNSTPTAPVASVTTLGVCPPAAVDLDGVDDHIDMGFGNELEETNFTIEAWARVDDEDDAHIVSRKTETSELAIKIDGGKFHALLTSSSGNCLIPAAETVPLGRWFHIALASSYDDRCALYLNGLEIGSSTDSGAQLGGTDNLILGARRFSPTLVQSHLDGLLTEVRVWNTFRDADQVRDDRYRRFTGGEAGLIAYWPFDEGGGTLGSDLTASTTGASLVGAGWGTAHASMNGLCSDGDGLICAFDDVSDDADEDAITYTIEWDVDGTPYTEAFLTSFPGDTIDGDMLIPSQTWTCEVTPNDGETDGPLASASLLLEKPASYNTSFGGTMVNVEAQTFSMGCTVGMSECYPDEAPDHEVTLSNDFYVSDTEITQGQYEDMMGTNPSTYTSCGIDCPVEKVSWHMAAAFANATSAAEGFEQCYSCTGTEHMTRCTLEVGPYECGGYRLPTEAEWEAAARCGEDLLFSGSVTLDDVGWYSANSGGVVHVVGTRYGNPCGLYDMSGNVWEWTHDKYKDTYYSVSPSIDPTGPTSTSNRVRRGGSFQIDSRYSRVSKRHFRGMTAQDSFIGFRIARSNP
jgi:formylglycine-generating enzyme required for sulfatase activity